MNKIGEGVKFIRSVTELDIEKDRLGNSSVADLKVFDHSEQVEKNK